MKLFHTRKDIDKDGPSLVMHEDDPISSNRWPTVFTRRNLLLAKSLAVAATIGFVILQQVQLQDTQSRLNQYLNERRDANFADKRQQACFLVRHFPNTEPDARDIRLKYDCPPYQPRGLRSSSGNPQSPSSRPGALPAQPSATVIPGQTIVITKAAANPLSPPPTRTSVVVRTPAPRPGSRRTVTRTPQPTPTHTVTTTQTSGLLCQPIGLPIAVGCPP